MPLVKIGFGGAARLPDIIVHPPFQRREAAWAVVWAMVGLVAVSDYFSGIYVSLSIFYLVPISLATAWLGRRAGWALALGCTLTRFGSDVLIATPDTLPAHTWWNGCAALVIFLLVVYLIDALVSFHRRLEHKVAERTNELRTSIAERERLERDLLDVGSRERNAIGRELHDDLGQHLVATALAAQVLAQKTTDPAGAGDARQIVQWIETAIAKTRRLARGLLLSHIEPARFVAELEQLAADSSRGATRVQVQHTGLAVQVSGGQCAQLFRIAQEAVGNALRHAGADTVEITLANDAEALCLIIADDGRGLQSSAAVGAPPSASGGMGLRIMEHRARYIGASFSIWSAPGEGTKIVVRLPHSESSPVLA